LNELLLEPHSTPTVIAAAPRRDSARPIDAPVGPYPKRRAYGYLRRESTTRTDRLGTERAMRALARSQGLDPARTLVERHDGAAIRQLLGLIQRADHDPFRPVVIVASLNDLCYGVLLEFFSPYAEVLVLRPVPYWLHFADNTAAVSKSLPQNVIESGHVLD
jgi:hypothetical protein